MKRVYKWARQGQSRAFCISFWLYLVHEKIEIKTLLYITNDEFIYSFPSNKEKNEPTNKEPAMAGVWYGQKWKHSLYLTRPTDYYGGTHETRTKKKIFTPFSLSTHSSGCGPDQQFIYIAQSSHDIIGHLQNIYLHASNVLKWNGTVLTDGL